MFEFPFQLLSEEAFTNRTVPNTDRLIAECPDDIGQEWLDLATAWRSKEIDITIDHFVSEEPITHDTIRIMRATPAHEALKIICFNRDPALTEEQTVRILAWMLSLYCRDVVPEGLM